MLGFYVPPTAEVIRRPDPCPENECQAYVVVVVLGFYVPPTAEVIRRRDLGLKYPKDWRSLGLNSGLMVYKASSLTNTPRRLLPGLSKLIIRNCLKPCFGVPNQVNKQSQSEA